MRLQRASGSRRRRLLLFVLQLLRGTSSTTMGFVLPTSSSAIISRTKTTISRSATPESINFDKEISHTSSQNRRSFLSSAVATLTTAGVTLSSSPRPAQARGLITFPCTTPLLNRYHMMRAGTTLLEEQDIWSTNPLFLTNREAALSEVGVAQVKQAAELLQKANIQPSIVKYSFAASSIDSANVLKQELVIGQNRLVPEFFFMDPRAVGKFDMSSIEQVQPAVIALDVMEAGPFGVGGKPPPNDDGTPNETLQDQSIRLRQLLSAMEAQYSGDDIVLVFPDASSAALLSCMMAGIPYNQVHLLDYQPGELRLNVNMESTLALYEERQTNNMEEYNALVAKGKDELKQLQSMDLSTMVSKKDTLIEQERLEQDRAYQESLRTRDEKAKQLRFKEIERVRQQKETATIMERGDNGSTIPPVAIAAAMGVFVAASFSGGQPEDGQDEAKLIQNDTEDFNLAVANQIDTPVQKNPFETTTPPPASLARPTSIQSPTTTKQQPPTPEERAKLSMQEYLDQDDGANDWLEMMEELAAIPDKDSMADEKSAATSSVILDDEDAFQ